MLQVMQRAALSAGSSSSSSSNGGGGGDSNGQGRKVLDEVLRPAASEEAAAQVLRHVEDVAAELLEAIRSDQCDHG